MCEIHQCTQRLQEQRGMKEGENRVDGEEQRVDGEREGVPRRS